MSPAASILVWSPQEPGVQQICYLLSEYQKPGTNQTQVRVWINRSTLGVFPQESLATAAMSCFPTWTCQESDSCTSCELIRAHKHHDYLADPCTIRRVQKHTRLQQLFGFHSLTRGHPTC